MSQTVFGAEAVVTFLNRAFNNTAPGNLIFQNQVAAAGTSSTSQYAFATQFGQSFSSLSDADLAAKVLGNMGVLPNADLVTALTDYFASVGTDARGIVVLQLGQILANLEGATGDLAIFAPAAAAWNNEVTLSFEYSTNPANTATVDPLLDTVKPVATAPTATVNYNENQVADAVLATVTASDNVSVTGFEISEGNDAGFFAINADGKITLTTAGLASTANDADDAGAAAANTFTLKVKAVDAAGNKSDAVEVKLEVKDVDDAAPTLTSAVIVGTTATLTFNEDLQGSPAVADFKVKIAGGAGEVTINKVEVQGKSLVLTLASAPSAGQSYTVDYTGTSLTDKAATPNALAAIAAAALVTDVTAPTFAAGQIISYKEGFADDAADVLGTVVATDATGVSTFSIVSGNTEGFFAISNEGKLTLTAAGLTSAANDFETLPNSFTLGVKATDGAGNATTQNVTVTVTNNTADDAAAPLELTLTSQTDAKAGESGDDTFIGDQNSVQPADVIDGNGGKDTARLTFASDATPKTYTLTSREVETLKLQEVSGANNGTTIFNAINVTELETLVNNNTTITGVGTLAVTNLKNQVTLGVVGGDGTDDFSVSYASGVTVGNPLKVELDGANLRNLILTDDKHTSIEFKTTGSINSTINDLVEAVGDDLDNVTTLIFNGGDKQLTINNKLEGVTTFTATNNSGAVRVVIDDTKDVTFSGGSGNDRVDVQAAGLTSSDKLDGGTGTDTLRIGDGAMLTTVNAANVKGFEILETRNAGVQTYEVDNIIANNVLTGVQINGAGATTVNNINAAALGGLEVLADEAAALTLTGKSFSNSGGSDTATIKLDNSVNNAANGVDVASISFAGLDTLTLSTVKSATQGNQQATIANLLAGDLNTVSIKGNNSLAVVFDAGTNQLDSIDATELTESVVIQAGGDNTGSGALIKGTAKADVLVGTRNGTSSGDEIIGGQGSDVMAVDPTAASQRDTFRYTATALGSGDLTAGDSDSLYGFSAGAADDTFDAADDVILLSSTVLANLKVGGTAVKDLTNGTALGGTLNNTNNIVAVDVDTDGAGGNDSIAIQIDLNGDGQYTASADVQIVVRGHTIAGSDQILWNKDAQALYLGAAGGAAAGADYYAGDAAANTIWGSGGADNITGDAGNDTITAGDGADDIMGGAGSDTIVLTEAVAANDIVRYSNVAEFSPTTFDTVTGFVLANDTVRFTTAGNIETGVIDDVTADDTITWNSSAIDAATNAVNLATSEAIHLTQTGGALDLTSLAAVATLLGTEVALTSATGADALIAIQSGGRTGLYLFTEDGVATNAVAAGELTLIGTVDALLATGNFAIAA